MNDLEALAVLEECPIERKIVRPTPRRAQVELWGAQKDYGLQTIAPAEVVEDIVLAEIVEKKTNWRPYIFAAVVAAVFLIGPYIAALLYFS